MFPLGSWQVRLIDHNTIGQLESSATQCCFLISPRCVIVLSVCCLQVCDAVQVRPGLPEQLLQVLDEFSAAGGAEVLYDRLSRVLQQWPQLLRDFAAFLTPGQASRCGLVGDVIMTS